MSVIKAERDEGKLQVLTKARDMMAYTITICKNEKHFPKRDRWILTQHITGEAIQATMCIRRANAVRVEMKRDFDFRRSQQVQAYSHLEALLTLIEVAYNTLGLASDKVEYWTGLVLDVETYLQKWMRTDKRRYGEGKPEAESAPEGSADKQDV